MRSLQRWVSRRNSQSHGCGCFFAKSNSKFYHQWTIYRRPCRVNRKACSVPPWLARKPRICTRMNTTWSLIPMAAVLEITPPPRALYASPSSREGWLPFISTLLLWLRVTAVVYLCTRYETTITIPHTLTLTQSTMVTDIYPLRLVHSVRQPRVVSNAGKLYWRPRDHTLLSTAAVVLIALGRPEKNRLRSSSCFCFFFCFCFVVLI